jgi:dTDP-4-amino-4,6-dideoxygalactose transaminase
MGATERALLLDAFDSNWIAPLGPHVDAFEQELTEVTGTGAAALSSGTAALHLALIILGVDQGDSVVVADLTFAATANAVRYAGAIPTFVDASPDTWTIDPALLRQALQHLADAGKPAKAVITVDLYGQCADYDAIRAVCADYDVPVVQDAAEALGATYRGRPAGQQGDIAALSFNGNKIITTSGGGALLSNRPEWIARAKHLSTQARMPAAHYEHEEVGYNYRLSNVLAAIGRGQLQHLSERVAARRANFETYRGALASLPGWGPMPEAPYGHSNRWLSCFVIDPNLGPDREQIRLALEAENIEARPVWKPMHLQPAFASYRFHDGGCGERLFRNGLCLPSGSSLTAHDRERIVDIVKRRVLRG